jgi:phosphatidylinositol-bisphosphatase
LSAPAFDRHFSQLASEYGSVAIINLLGSNLVGSKEGEATLSTAYQSQQSRSQHQDIPHLLWDFHAEGGVKNLDRLESKVCNLVDRLSFFYSTGVDGSAPAQLQGGVVRTNCTDCLDRTNAVQMWLGRT